MEALTDAKLLCSSWLMGMSDSPCQSLEICIEAISFSLSAGLTSNVISSCRKRFMQKTCITMGPRGKVPRVKRLLILSMMSGMIYLSPVTKVSSKSFTASADRWASLLIVNNCGIRGAASKPMASSRSSLITCHSEFALPSPLASVSRSHMNFPQLAHSPGGMS